MNSDLVDKFSYGRKPWKWTKTSFGEEGRKEKWKWICLFFLNILKDYSNIITLMIAEEIRPIETQRC